MLIKFIKKHIYPLFIVLILGGVYLKTLLPTVGYSGDTAKFQFVPRFLGTVHETGYPAYLTLNYLFTRFFPFGELAYKSNLLSAIFAVFSVVIIYYLLCQLKINKTIAFISSLTFGFTQTFWSQSIVAEVYTLNLLFLSSTFYFFLKWREKRLDRYFFVACGLYAFSFGNHMSIVTFLPAIIYFVWNTDKKVFISPKKILGILFLISLGALQYYYLFWRYNVPETTFLEINISDWPTFWYYVTGGQFKVKMFSFTVKQLFADRLPFYIGLLFKEYLFLVPIIIIGFFSFKQDKFLYKFLLLSFFFNWFYAVNYDTWDIEVFFIPGYFLLTIYLSQGINFLWQKLSPVKFKIGIYLLFLIPLFFLSFNYKKVDQSGKIEISQKISAILSEVQSNSLIIAPDYDHTEYIYYYLIARGFEKNNIFVLFNFDPLAIKSYLEQDQLMYIPEKRQLAPQGLKVYVFNEVQQMQLRDVGLKIKAITPDLFQISK